MTTSRDAVKPTIGAVSPPRTDGSLGETDREALRDLIRGFATEVVGPRVLEYDREERMPRDILDRMAELGFFGGTVPPEWGGLGLDHLTYAQLIEEISRVDHILGVFMSMPSALVGGGLLRFGTDAQKEQWLAALARGGIFGGAGVTETQPGGAVALPVSVSHHAEAICAEAGTPVIQTKLSPVHLMEVSSHGEVVFGASQSGGFLWPGFLPAFDGAATLVELVAMLARTGQPLSKLVHGLPAIHIAHQGVMTPWEQKGMVMRTLVEQLDGRDLVLVDGVKVPEEDGWALVLPDPDEPVTHVWAEGPSDARAGARAQQYAVRLRQLLRSGA